MAVSSRRVAALDWSYSIARARNALDAVERRWTRLQKVVQQDLTGQQWQKWQQYRCGCHAHRSPKGEA
jgi:hypothetical protein